MHISLSLSMFTLWPCWTHLLPCAWASPSRDRTAWRWPGQQGLTSLTQTVNGWLGPEVGRVYGVEEGKGSDREKRMLWNLFKRKERKRHWEKKDGFKLLKLSIFNYQRWTLKILWHIPRSAKFHEKVQYFKTWNQPLRQGSRGRMQW